MKRLIACILLMAFTAISWAVPKPMESIENYNVMIVHGAYVFPENAKSFSLEK